MKYLSEIVNELRQYMEFFIDYAPGRVGYYLRRKYYSSILDCGRNLTIGVGVTITGRENIKLGNNVSIMKNSSVNALNAKVIIGDNFSMNANSWVDAVGGVIQIGNDVLIAQNVVLRAADHEHKSTLLPIMQQGHIGGGIIIGNGVWIAANCVITRSVTINEHSIVAAGAVVTKDVESYSIVAGVPARKIKDRFTKEELKNA
jgi:galactoside O-acetyltransferase